MGVILQVEALGYQRDTKAVGERGFEMEVGSLALHGGEAIGIVGPSGCGKSTLIDLLALLRKPSRADRFELLGHDVAALWRREALQACNALRAAHVGVVLQTGGLLPGLPLLENVLLSQRLLGAVDLAWARHLLAALELTDLVARRPAQLSIGQRQRTAIARALAHRPALVLADEPTASLGVEHAPAALDLLLSLARDSEAALLVVSHDVDLLKSRDIPRRPFAVHDGVVSLGAG